MVSRILLISVGLPWAGSTSIVYEHLHELLDEPSCKDAACALTVRLADLGVGSYELDTEIRHANASLSADAQRLYFSVSTPHLSSMKYLRLHGFSMQTHTPVTSASPVGTTPMVHRRSTFPVPPDAFAEAIISDGFASAIDKATGEAARAVTVISFHIGPSPCVCVARGGEVLVLFDVKMFFRNMFFLLNLGNRNEGLRSSLSPLMLWIIRVAETSAFDFGVLHLFAPSHHRWWFDDLARDFAGDKFSDRKRVEQWIVAANEPSAATAAMYLTDTSLATGARVLVSVSSGAESPMIMYTVQSLKAGPMHMFPVLHKRVVSRTWILSAFELLALSAAELFYTGKGCTGFADEVCRSVLDSQSLVNRASVLAGFGKVREEWSEYLKSLPSEASGILGISPLERERRWSAWRHDLHLASAILSIVEKLKSLSNETDESISLISRSQAGLSFSRDVLASAQAMLESAVLHEFGSDIDSSAPLVIGGVAAFNLRLVGTIRERTALSDVRVTNLPDGSLSALGGLWTVVPPPWGSHAWAHTTPIAVGPFLIPLRSWHIAIKPVRANLDPVAMTALLEAGAVLVRMRSSQALSEYPSWQPILSLPRTRENAERLVSGSSSFWFEKLTLLVATSSELSCCCARASGAGPLTPFTALACEATPELLSQFGWVHALQAGRIHVKAVSPEVDPWLFRVIDQVRLQTGVPGVIESRYSLRAYGAPLVDPVEAFEQLLLNNVLSGVLVQDALLYSSRHRSISRLLASSMNLN